jgi:hypothetical protein
VDALIIHVCMRACVKSEHHDKHELWRERERLVINVGIIEMRRGTM